MAWLSGWKYRKQMTIAGTADGAQTNYQLQLTVYRSSGVDAGGVVYLGPGKCEADYDDIRITNSDGVTQRDYWIEYADANYATIWIEFDSIPASPSTATFYIYYGNAGATAVSNGDNTFKFFDDFGDASLDPAKWATDNLNLGTVTEASGYLTLDISAGAGASRAAITSSGIKTIAGNFALQATYSSLAMSSYYAQSQIVVANGADEWGIDRRKWTADRGMSHKAYGGYAETPFATTDSGNIHRLTRVGTTCKSDYWNGASWTNVRSDVIDIGDVYVRLLCANDALSPATIHVHWDNLFARNFTTNEPTWSTWGAEENYLVGGMASCGCGR